MDWGGWGSEFARGVSDWERCNELRRGVVHARNAPATPRKSWDRGKPGRWKQRLYISRKDAFRAKLFLGFVVFGVCARRVGESDCFARRSAVWCGTEILNRPTYGKAQIAGYC